MSPSCLRLSGIYVCRAHPLLLERCWSDFDGVLCASASSYTWQLRDVPEGAGGFCLIPASHRSRFPLPRPPTTAIDLPAVKHMTPNAGDIIFYHGGGTVHGVKAWKDAQERRAVLKTAIPVSSMQDMRLAHINAVSARL